MTLVTSVAIAPITIPENWRSRWHHRLSGRHLRRLVWGSLAAIHFNLLMVGLLAMWHLQPGPARRQRFDMPLSAIAELSEPLPRVEPTLSVTPPELPEGLPLIADAIPIPASVPDAPQIPSPLPGYAAPSAIQPPDGSGLDRSPQLLLMATDFKVGGGYEGRTAAARDRLVASRGGSPASERAVMSGLLWLAEHQRSDGGWSFDLRGTRCNGQCRHAGRHQSATAATGLALLAFLGAGQTHCAGEHQQAVGQGLHYLVGRIVPSSRGADLQDGTMYAQGIATLALCEAYALTGDSELRLPAQQALAFIGAAQHPLGGWRYFPGQPGDTTVLGWQLMALHSGRLAGLEVPERAIERAEEFLDRAAGENGATYGYQASGDDPTPTAVGLLCRMYQGWQRSDERLRAGVDRLAARGPDLDDLYFTYYATQTLQHFDGPQWDGWNQALRDRLIARQSLTGHEAGSWHTPSYHTAPGGRLCDTALAIMILEVYYRHLPLYGYRGVGEFW